MNVGEGRILRRHLAVGSNQVIIRGDAREVQTVLRPGPLLARPILRDRVGPRR